LQNDKKMKKLPIDYLGAFGSTVGDVYFPQTKLLLPFNGANGATTTSDLSNTNATVSFNGNASLSTAQSKFGGSSVYFDGSSDYLSIPDSSGWHIGTNEFTIEFWWRYTALPSNDWNSFCSQRYQWNDAAPFNFSYKTYGGANVLGLNLNNGTVSVTASWAPSINTWYHLAVCRDSSNIRFFVDGVQIGTNTANTTDISNSSEDLWLGSSNAGGSPTSSSNGHMDSFRFTNGTARYTADFTPPTTAHLTSAGDVNKQIIINSAADGVAIGTGGVNQARIAKAWVNFNGSGTVAIRDSYNVSSITDDGTGKYKVNFSTAMSNINYSAVVDGKYTESGDAVYNTVGFLRRIATATSYIGVRGIGGNASSSFDDLTTCNVIVFGN
jgi:hypothetical protein